MQDHVLKNIYKIGFWGNFGRMLGLLSCEVCFYCVASQSG